MMTTWRTSFVFWATLVLGVTAAFVLGAYPVWAQELDVGLAPLTETGLGGGDLRIMIARIVRALLGLLGIVAFAYIIYGGVLWMIAGGRTEAVEKAQRVIINAVIGIVIVLSSLAITQFIISRLAEATGFAESSALSSGGPLGGPGPAFGGSGFALQSITPTGAVPIRNVVVQMGFSSRVDSATTANNILVRVIGSTEPVAGDISTSGSVVRFTPTATCPAPNTSRRCFAADTPHEVIIGAGLRGTNGAFVSCGFSACRGTFTTGNLIDTLPPAATITYPSNNGAVSINTDVPVTVTVTDDSGVGLVEVLADDTAIGTDAPASTLTTFFGTVDWDTTGLAAGSQHVLDAIGTDIAGQSVEAATVRVTVKPAHCFNVELDADFGETGIDCGGDATSAEYCGACEGSSCTIDADCSSGHCVAGVCAVVPEIVQVIPNNGGPGNFVTISGTNFGASVGNVVFLGDPMIPDDDAIAALACPADGWLPTQVIVSVPNNAFSGPLLLATSTGTLDRTDDDVGPLLDFTVNSAVRPGLCSVAPTAGGIGAAVTLAGNSFGVFGPSSSIFFDAIGAGTITSWANALVRATVPPLAAGAVDVTVWSGGESSNPVAFSVTEAETGALPTIAYVDPPSGPIGEYLTIFGSNFGSAVGTVRFVNPTSGYEAVGDTDFPDACADTGWSSTQITVKVPEEYTNEIDVAALTHNLRIVRADSVASTAIGFAVETGMAGPGICAASPVSGPTGTLVHLYGERFGSTPATVTFYNAQIATVSLWSAEHVSAFIPTAAVTGPVKVTVGGNESNGVNVTVGACNPASATSCSAGYVCCAETLSCTLAALGCPTGPTLTNYLFEFSTGEIPVVPYVLRQCSSTTVDYSPSPWDGRSGGAATCPNALIRAQFNVKVVGLGASTVSVKSCDAPSTATDPCSVVSPVAGSFVIGPTYFVFSPSSLLAPNHTYRVTIDDAVTTPPPALEPMAEPYVFTFKTRDNASPCVLTSVVVTPEDTTLSDIGNGIVTPTDTGDATLLSAGLGAQSCVLLSTAGNTVSWALSNNPGPAVAYSGPTNAASVIARALAETTAGAVQAIVTLVEQGLTGRGLVQVNFADPAVQAHWPACDTACFGAAIGARFNVSMRDTGVGAVSPATVTLARCANELCEGTLDPLGILVNLVDSGRKAQIVPLTPLDPATAAGAYYRVTIDGSVRSQNGVALTGLNAPGAYTWTFRMNTEGELCTIDRVEVDPPDATLYAVGARQSFVATPFGPPDACSEQGQRVNGWSYGWSWASSRTATAFLHGPLTPAVGDLDISILRAPGCTNACTRAGSTPNVQVCGNGVVEGFCSNNIARVCDVVADVDADCAAGGFCNLTLGEECDDGNLLPADGCSSSCLNEGSPACVIATGTFCCGNGTIDVGSGVREECDDSNTVSGDGCSSSCRREGAASVGARCGNNLVAQLTSTSAGEDCDDGNVLSGDGCSSSCLAEGSTTHIAVCGNGVIEPGEDCDNGNTVSGDGCSSQCLYEGGVACATGGPTTQCCGNNIVENTNFEQCDGGEGCSVSCLLLGSSLNYISASLCGDGVLGNGLGASLGEAAACDGPSVSLSGDGRIDPVQVAETASAAQISAQAVPVDGLYSSTISAQETLSSEVDSANLYISCSCNVSSDCAIIGGDYGCGQATSCCFARPEVTDFAPDGTGACRNAEVRVVFDQKMDEASFTSVPPNSTAQAALRLLSVPVGGCPAGYTMHAPLTVISPVGLLRDWAHRLWRAVVPESAALVTGGCYLPATIAFETVDGYTEAIVQYDQPLQPNAQYQIEVFGDTNPANGQELGVLNVGGVGMVATSSGVAASQTFTTGSNVCTLDRLSVDDISDSPGLFLAAGEVHDFVATPLASQNGSLVPIVPLTGIYEWELSWSISDDGTIVDFVAPPTGATAQLVSGTESGQASARASAEVTVDPRGFSLAGHTVSNSSVMQVFICEVPWPDDPTTLEFEAPLSDTHGNDDGLFLARQWTNFSTLYCRAVVLEENDLGVPVIPATALPRFVVTQVDYTQTATAGVIKEFLLRHPTRSEGIGIRVSENPNYLPIDQWYLAQGFAGAPRALRVDGYRALQDGRTVYVAALNSSKTGPISPVVFTVSYSLGASPETIDVFNQVVSNMRFLASTVEGYEVTNARVCVDASGVAVEDDEGEPISCTTNIECADAITAGGPPSVCDANQDKLKRDLARIEDVRTLEASLNAYGVTHRHCSVTSNLVCVDDAQCPGAETCEADVPLLGAGTFLTGWSTSVWPSWNAELGNALGRALPVDPLNVHLACPAGYDAQTCWNATESLYTCPAESHVYGYRRLGIGSWQITADMELPTVQWEDAFAPLADSVGTIVLGGMNDPTATTPAADSCTGAVYGATAVCGDGLLGASELCEIGGTSVETCTQDFDGDGVIDDPDDAGVRVTGCVAAGNNACQSYTNDVDGNGAPDSACVQAGCGNGVVEGVCSASGTMCTSSAGCPSGEICDFAATAAEDCDDGSFNGQYGFCGLGCTYATAQFCGNGDLDGGEICDCGSLGFPSLSPTCTGTNGEYNSSSSVYAGCAWDCSSWGGPQCGDAEVQDGDEECDGGFETWSGRLCYDGANVATSTLAPCTSNADCPASETCGGSNATNVCAPSDFCVGGSMSNAACTTSCPGGGVCTTFNTFRSRSCAGADALLGGPSAACTWNQWSACVQQGSCGDGLQDPGEQCDDGNTINGDGCTNLCRTNVCGDGFLNPATESCDFGTANGETCVASYGSPCNYCNASCQYQTLSGGYCGDGQKNGPEVCDGSPPLYWIDINVTGQPKGTINGICSYVNATLTVSPDILWCAAPGACNGGVNNNGGSTNGAFCIVGSYVPWCGTGGTCVVAECDASCGSSCPSNYQSSFVQGQPWYSNNDSTPEAILGAPFDDTLELYAYQKNGQCYSQSTNEYGSPCTNNAQCLAPYTICEFQNAPDMAKIQIPACTVGTSLVAQVSYDITYPQLDVVFVLDGSNSMNNPLGGSTRWLLALEAMEDAISEIFLEYPGVARIGVVKFHGAADPVEGGYLPHYSSQNCSYQPYWDASAQAFVWPDDWTDIDPDNPSPNNAAVDYMGCIKSLPRGQEQEDLIMSGIGAAAGGTPLAGGLLTAHDLLSRYPADHHRVVILLSDGMPQCFLSSSSTNESFTSSPCGAVAEAVTEAAADIKSDGMDLYTAYFGSTTDTNGQCKKRSMERWSSNCPTSLPTSFTSDCQGVYSEGETRHECQTAGTFAYTGNTADAFTVMVTAIVNDLIHPRIEVGPSESAVSTQLYQGASVAIPLPPNFACNASASQEAPVALDFEGQGTVTLNQIRFNHCAP